MKLKEYAIYAARCAGYIAGELYNLMPWAGRERTELGFPEMEEPPEFPSDIKKSPPELDASSEYPSNRRPSNIADLATKS